MVPELRLVCFGYVSANPTLAERRLLPQVVAAETFRNSRANSSLPLFRVMRRTLRAYGDWLRKELGGGAREASARYRRARQSLRTSISARNRHALDWTNFFLADVQTGFGAFVAYNEAHLAK